MKSIYESLADSEEYLLLNYYDSSEIFPHYHKSIEIVYCIEGETEFFVDGQKFILRANEIFFAPSFSVHYNKSVGHNLILSLVYSNDFMYDFRKTFPNKTFPYCLKDHDYNLGILEYLKEFEKEKPLKHFELCRLQKSAFVNELLWRLVKNYKLINESFSNSDKKLTNVLTYINNHFNEKITQSTLSDHFGYNPHYLSRLFNRTVSCNLSSYVNNLRIQFVEESLKDKSNNKSLAEIIGDSGFGSIATYYRVKSKYKKSEIERDNGVLIAPFEKGKMIYDESAIFTKNKKFECSLLFPVKEILSITNFDKTISYPIEDFAINKNKLTFNGEDIISLTKNEYEGKEGDPADLADMKKYRIKRPYYSESYFCKKQLLISYVPKSVDDYFTSFGNASLKVLKEKLKNRQNIKMVVYGDSISTGMTSSLFMKRPPYTAPWFELLREGIESKYYVKVDLFNKSEIGIDSAWGVTNMEERLPTDADLYILGFGMNDGTGGVAEDVYISNMKKMVERIGDKDIILISTIIPNPDAELLDGTKFLNKQEAYYPYLKKLENDHICVADFTQFHKNILLKKNYYDITGNNINHPNDFLGRMMAMALLKMLEQKESK